MILRFHGIDRHKKYSTVSVLDCDGKEVRFLRSCAIEDYLSSLGAEDAVVLEASCGCFYWADRIEATGATCFVLDPRRFRIISDPWNKTDRQDARNMAKALWVFLVTGEFGIPTVYKPSETIRILRRLFATYNLLNRQIRMLKNAIQAMLTDDGVVLTSGELARLFAGRESVAGVLSERSPLYDDRGGCRDTGHSPAAGQRIEGPAGPADRGPQWAVGRTDRALGHHSGHHPADGCRLPGHITRESRKLSRTVLSPSLRHSQSPCRAGIYFVSRLSPPWRFLHRWSNVSSPRFLGNPSGTSAPLLDPGGCRVSGSTTPRCCPRNCYHEGSRYIMIFEARSHGFCTRCLRFALWSPSRARLAPGWLPAFTGRDFHPLGYAKRF